MRLLFVSSFALLGVSACLVPPQQGSSGGESTSEASTASATVTGTAATASGTTATTTTTGNASIATIGSGGGVGSTAGGVGTSDACPSQGDTATGMTAASSSGRPGNCSLETANPCVDQIVDCTGSLCTCTLNGTVTSTMVASPAPDCIDVQAACFGTGGGTGGSLCNVPVSADVVMDGGVGCTPEASASVCDAEGVCSSTCPSGQYQLSCAGAPSDIPTPSSSLGCVVLPIPTPSNETEYCCPCGS